jgi:hypothetical protein
MKPADKSVQDALFAFSLLRSIAFTSFEHLYAHHQEVLHVQQLVRFVLELVELFKITYVQSLKV